MNFFQEAPELSNQYEADQLLQQYLAQTLPPSVLGAIESELQRMGERAVSDIWKLGKEAEKILPVHIPYDPWGRRIDEIETSSAWKQLDAISAQEGLVAIAYRRAYAEYSRIFQFTKLFLFHPSSGMYTCPLAMTDGAARLLEVYGDQALKERAFPRLTSTDPELFWTSGQWMTERTGGSDVSGTSTVARVKEGQWELFGDKWFTSATTSQMAMTLARIEGDDKLSLFYIELRDEQGKLQNIRVNRLKDKLGTKALPTAELTLEGTPATLVGERGKGVKTIATLFNITRVYNAICAVAYMRRGIALATAYASKRKAFGRPLQDHPLHLETLADMQVRYEASFYLAFHAVRLLGREEVGTASEREKKSLRLLIPLAKLFTAKEAVAVISEVLECFGGAGYVEDTGLPALLRDTQVLSIWEGTTNVLSLDALRAIRREEAGEAFLAEIRERAQGAKNQVLAVEVLKAVEWLEHVFQQNLSEEELNASARVLSFNLARTYAASLMLQAELKSAGRWIEKGLIQGKLVTKDESRLSAELLK
jgi:putative acyl-CoA dehydrogenase